jgi:ABC-2 type transport system permease protein
MLISQLLIFVIFGFSPISYPPENLPGWLATIHDYLPFFHMANAVRDGLTDGLAVDVGRSYVVLAVWAGLSAAISAAVLGRRK